jgi:hypothetical protein
LRSQNRNRSEPYSFGDSGTGTVFGIRFRFQVQGNEAKHSRKFIKSLIISFHVRVGIGTGTGTAVQVQGTGTGTGIGIGKGVDTRMSIRTSIGVCTYMYSICIRTVEVCV